MKKLRPKDAMNLLNDYKEKARKLLQNSQDLDRFLDQVERKLRTIPIVGKDLAVVPAMLSLLKQYAAGTYKKVPYGTVLAIAGALLYLLNPFDLVPDTLPGIGLLDDVAVLKACLGLVSGDLKDFKKWQAEQELILNQDQN